MSSYFLDHVITIRHRDLVLTYDNDVRTGLILQYLYKTNQSPFFQVSFTRNVRSTICTIDCKRLETRSRSEISSRGCGFQNHPIFPHYIHILPIVLIFPANVQLEGKGTYSSEIIEGYSTTITKNGVAWKLEVSIYYSRCIWRPSPHSKFQKLTALFIEHKTRGSGGRGKGKKQCRVRYRLLWRG